MVTENSTADYPPLSRLWRPGDFKRSPHRALLRLEPHSPLPARSIPRETRDDTDPESPKQRHALLIKSLGDLDVAVSCCVAGADIQTFEDRFVVLQNDRVIEIQSLWIKEKRLDVH